MTLFEFSELASNFSELITAIALIVAGVWSLKNYLRSKRVEAARWLHELGQDFQFSDDLERGKFLLDFKYKEEVEPLLSSLIFHWTKGLTDEQLKGSVELDKVLNQFEHLLFLQANGHITDQDREVYFGYWFSLLKEKNRGVLRRYCANFGYDQLARNFFPKYHRYQTDEYLVVYGTLWKGSEMYLKLEIEKYCQFIEDVTIKGCLYDIGEYPGLVLEEDLEGDELAHVKEVPVQIFRINKTASPYTPLKILAEIDKYEGCNQQTPAASEYRRTTFPVLLGKDNILVDAWIYLYQKETKGKTRIVDKSWVEYDREL